MVTYIMSQKKSSLMAIFTTYEFTNKSKSRKTHFKKLQTEKGELLLEHFVLNEKISSKIIGHLTFGEIVSFTANVQSIELKNIEFCYPHSLRKI
jgi:hypothetical protein